MAARKTGLGRGLDALLGPVNTSKREVSAPAAPVAAASPAQAQAVDNGMRLLALELAEREVIVGIIGPGSVDTRGILEADPATLPERTRRRIESGQEKLLKPAEAIGSMITLIDGLTLEDSGVFYNWAGEVLPW